MFHLGGETPVSRGKLAFAFQQEHFQPTFQKSHSLESCTLGSSPFQRGEHPCVALPDGVVSCFLFYLIDCSFSYSDIYVHIRASIDT